MSGIGGVFHADGSPVDRALLERMRDIIGHRGPDGSGIWAGQGVGLVHRLLMNTEESVSDQQPMTNGRGLWITADCRIDNREELKQSFESKGLWREMQKLFNSRPIPDSAFILFAYELWGEDSPNHLLGDFAFAVWDQPRQTLFCARDPVGMKPFAYHWDGKRFLFGSEMKQIFQGPSVSTELDVSHLAEILIDIPDYAGTPYLRIRRLPPGHAIRILGGNFDIRDYRRWNPETEPPSRGSLEENARRFQHLFEEVVRARLRTPPGFRAGAFLSGGLDSSSVASVAALLQRESGGSAAPFPVFTAHFPEFNPAYQKSNMDPPDERFYSEAVVRKHRLESHVIPIQGIGPFSNSEFNFWHQESPFCSEQTSRLMRAAREASVRGILTGDGGDHIFGVGSRCLTEEFKRGNFSAFFREGRARQKRSRGAWGRLGLALLLSFIPEAVKIPYRRFARRAVPEWIDPVFAKRIGLRERIKGDFRRDPRWHTSASYGILYLLRAGTTPYYLETFNRVAEAFGMEARSPFFDLRLLRFAASVPWDQKVREGKSKFLLREALKDALPSEVQGRLRKSEFSPVHRFAMERYAMGAVRELERAPHPVLREMVLPEGVRVLCRPTLLSSPQAKGLRFFWNLVNVDQWLKYQGSFLKKVKEGVDHEKSERFVPFAEGTKAG